MIQYTLVCLTALVATTYLLRSLWRTWSGRGCRSGCGCGPKKEAVAGLIPASDLGLRIRSRASGKRDEGEK
jgi:hypothetical protein